MTYCYPTPLDELAVAALNPAVERDGHDWAQIVQWLNDGCAQVWQINGTGYVLTLANGDDEVEALLAGGSNAVACAPVWERAMLARPEHAGMTLRVDGRKGWRRLLKEWDCDENGVLTRRVPS